MKTRIPLLVIGICLVTYLMLVPIMRSLLLPAIAVVLNLITVGDGVRHPRAACSPSATTRCSAGPGRST